MVGDTIEIVCGMVEMVYGMVEKVCDMVEIGWDENSYCAGDGDLVQ